MTCKEAPRVFNKEYLDTLLTQDSATLIGSYEKLHGGLKIKYKCICSQECEKLFRDIAYYGGAYCKACVIKNKSNKIKETCKKLYGVTNVSQVDKYQKKKEETYLERFGMHPRKTEEVKNKYKETCLQRYGVENAAQTLEIKNKIKEIFEEKYGGHPMFDEKVKDKVKNTCIDKYGGYPAENNQIKEKIKQTCIEKYGSYPTQCEKIKEKITSNNLQKYGCHPSQTIEVMDKIQKNSKKYKKYVMPSGTVRLIQGYESFALDELLQIYTEDEIVSERKYIPRFQYTINEKRKYYFPDIYLPSTKTIIEVKSSWTYEKDKEKLECVKRIIENEGYLFTIRIYNKDGSTYTII